MDRPAPTTSWLRQNNATGRIPLNLSGKSALPVRPVLSRQEGRIAIVTNAGGDAVDAAASARRLFAGRFSVSGRQRAGRTAPKPGQAFCRSRVAAYGKNVWFWHPLLV